MKITAEERSDYRVWVPLWAGSNGYSGYLPCADTDGMYLLQLADTQGAFPSNGLGWMVTITPDVAKHGWRGKLSERVRLK